MRLTLISGGSCGSNPSIYEGRPRLTTSFGVIRGTDGIVIDQGSGIQHVANRFMSDGKIERIFILQTHLHDDHVCGIPYNKLLTQDKIPMVGIWAPRCAGTSFDRVWDDRRGQHNWPVRGADIPRHNFNLDDDEPRLILPLGITIQRLNHAGGSVAYRIPHERGDIVIATDHEPTSDTNAAYASFVSGARLLVADLQYRDSEYEGQIGIGDGPAMKRTGWGHATPTLLARALVGCDPLPQEIWITHHDPNRPGRDWDEFADEVFKYFKDLKINVSAFASDDEIEEIENIEEE